MHQGSPDIMAMLPRLLTELRIRRIILDSMKPVVEVSLVPNEILRKLKKDLLNKDVEIVDVLAFPGTEFPNPDIDGDYLGEVYINEDIARDDFSRAIFLLTHGVLHLLGYRHETKRDIIVMEQLEQDIQRVLLSQ